MNSSLPEDKAHGILEMRRTDALTDSFQRVRTFTEQLCEPLETEDYVVQTMADVSPAKWHLAHTSWFFEAFLLDRFDRAYTSPQPLYAYLFNSYYVQLGSRFSRPARGNLSRPTVKEVYAYRGHVNAAVQRLLERGDAGPGSEIASIVTLGLHHEQQHQELLLTDIKNVFAANPLRPVYSAEAVPTSPPAAELEWLPYDGGVRHIGYEGDGFSYDNEAPRHPEYVTPFLLAHRPVSNADFMAFIEDGGYRREELWLSDGAAAVQQGRWEAPMYWEARDGGWVQMTLHGEQAPDPHAPVTHVSFYEADAYARWAGARLPSEAEWEVASVGCGRDGQFVDGGVYHPVALPGEARPQQMLGSVWEWTRSPYTPYPGFRPLPGAAGEYNGKFMSSQVVLRGGSCATSADHIRNTYRNFFPPDARWQFSGLRLARDMEE